MIFPGGTGNCGTAIFTNRIIPSGEPIQLHKFTFFSGNGSRGGLGFALRALRYLNYRLFLLAGAFHLSAPGSHDVYRLTGSALLLGPMSFAGRNGGVEKGNQNLHFERTEIERQTNYA
jgi:hypothetical protein